MNLSGCKVKLYEGNSVTEIDATEVISIEVPMGEIIRFSDICGMGWMRCESCQNQQEGCGKRFYTDRMRSEPEPIEVVFTDGTSKLVDKYELIGL